MLELMKIQLLFFFTALCSQGGSILENPPADLASLLNPEQTLVALQHNSDNASLIALIQTGKPATAGVADADIAEAIAGLGSHEVAVRREARATLAKAGNAAHKALEEVKNHDDPEISMSARQLLAKIEAQEQEQTMQFDQAYLPRFMAIRLLGSLKCQDAVPALLYAKWRSGSVVKALRLRPVASGDGPDEVVAGEDIIGKAVWKFDPGEEIKRIFRENKVRRQVPHT